MGLVQDVAGSMSAERRAALAALLRRHGLAPRVRERAEMVKAAAQGQDLAEICRWSGRSAETVRHWLGRYLSGGLEALADAARPGRPARADATYQAALETAMARSPREVGLLFDVWTSARLSAHLAEQTGVRIAPGWLRVLLGRQRFVTGRPKHTLGHRRDADEVARCEADLAAAGEKSGGSTGAV